MAPSPANVLAGQGVHWGAPAVEKEPGGHGAHAGAGNRAVPRAPSATVVPLNAVPPGHTVTAGFTSRA